MAIDYVKRAPGQSGQPSRQGQPDRPAAGASPAGRGPAVGGRRREPVRGR